MVLVVSADEQARLIHGLSIALSVGAMGGKVKILFVLPALKAYITETFPTAVDGADKLPTLGTVKELLNDLGVDLIACSAAAHAVGMDRTAAATHRMSIKDMPVVLGDGTEQVVFV